ncbi:hypothetical protein [Candidatus Foliamicus sp.]
MRKGRIAGAALLLAFAAGAAQAHDPAAARAEWLGERLELSGEQQAQVDTILAESQAQREALRAQNREARDAMREQRKALREQSRELENSTRERLAGVLTEEQNARLDEMRKDMNQRAIMRRGGREGMRRGNMQRRWQPGQLYRGQGNKQQAQAPASDE